MRAFTEADTRGLAVFRAVYGAGLLVYLASRITGDSFVAFHTDLGVLPRVELMTRPFASGAWSALFMTGSPLGVAVCFAVAFATLTAFTVGYRTGASAVGTCVVLLSLHHRLPHVVNGAMCLAHLVSLHSLALPLGRHYSVDAWLARRRGETAEPLLGERVRSLGVLAFRLQLFYVYFFNVVHKTGPTWREGTAVHYALHDDRFARASAVWLRDHMPRWFSPAATYGTLAVESLIALCVLSPVFPRASRRVAVAGILVLHGAIALVLRIGPFPVVTASAACLLAASGDFTRFDAWLSPRLERFAGAVERMLRLGPAREPAPPTPLPAWLRRVRCALREGYFVITMLVLAAIVRHDSGFVKHFLGPYRLPPVVADLAGALYLAEGWGLFAPDPALSVGVLVVDMELADGRHVDPLRHEPPDFEGTRHRTFETDYFWQVYQSRMAEAASTDPRLVALLIDYLCRIPVLERWPGTHRIESVQVYFRMHTSPDPRGRVASPPRRVLLGRRGARFTGAVEVERIDAGLPEMLGPRPAGAR